MFTKSKRQTKTSLLSLCVISASLMVGAGQAFADKCYIMVHGHWR